MSNFIEVNDLQLIFGKGKKLEEAKKLLKDDASIDEIREKTSCAVGVKKVDFNVKKVNYS
ncbi:MAG: hypothetical protein PF445_11655 [Melioribacteraceae bacterium]|jgi:ABC-type proline/glycine betaine transport system ATPase subunit|nr:hypothetical protein [Melioribacteraceae bacterium]